MKKRTYTPPISDEEVEEEIKRLQKSEFVKLAYQEERIRNQRRRYLANLRWYEKKGRELAELGWTPDMAYGDGEDCEI